MDNYELSRRQYCTTLDGELRQRLDNWIGSRNIKNSTAVRELLLEGMVSKGIIEDWLKKLYEQ